VGGFKLPFDYVDLEGNREEEGEVVFGFLAKIFDSSC